MPREWGGDVIEVDGLSKTYHVHQKEPGLRGSLVGLFSRRVIEKHALKQTRLRVGEGEIVGLVGANGAGKTTLVKMLAGIMHPTAGTARVLGYVPWERDNAFRRQVALIMGQKAQLWWDLPAADCFRLLKEIYGIPEDRYRATLGFFVETLGVAKEMKVQIRRLSLGERMKMELIAALLHSPRVVYLDEPTIGLDLGAQSAIRAFLRDYQRTHRPAVLLTSHYMEDIEQLCERIVIMRSGEIVYDGALRSVLERHARYRILKLQLAPEATLAWADAVAAEGARARLAVETGLPPEALESVSVEAGRLVVRAPRARIPEVASRLMAALTVVDLAIEDDDISSVIEELIKA
jgi:ABC-2 type transport system ATP-binding protein